jgi:hypothetical protein
LFDTTNDFMFTEKYFNKYSFRPKPKALRRAPLQAIVPGVTSENKNSWKGQLLPPVIQ